MLSRLGIDPKAAVDEPIQVIVTKELVHLTYRGRVEVSREAFLNAIQGLEIKLEDPNK